MSYEISIGIAPAHSPSPIPKPGEVFDPVARALDLIGDKWTLVLVRHLLAGPVGFQHLRVRTGITARVLSARLRQLAAKGLVETVAGEGSRSLYAVTDSGRELAPIVAALARWYVHHAVEDLEPDVSRFTETSPLSILESLPFLLREERAHGADVTFEIRLTGVGGGAWSVHIEGGECRVAPGFAPKADVRYTADARTWCGVALGLIDPRKALASGELSKEGGSQAMDHYFHQIADYSRSSRSGRGEAR